MAPITGTFYLAYKNTAKSFQTKGCEYLIVLSPVEFLWQHAHFCNDEKLKVLNEVANSDMKTHESLSACLKLILFLWKGILDLDQNPLPLTQHGASGIIRKSPS